MGIERRNCQFINATLNFFVIDFLEADQIISSRRISKKIVITTKTHFYQGKLYKLNTYIRLEKLPTVMTLVSIPTTSKLGRYDCKTYKSFRYFCFSAAWYTIAGVR